MWFFTKKSYKPKHKHSYRVMRCAPYNSITGPKTIISYKCVGCPKLNSSTVNGIYEVTDLR